MKEKRNETTKELNEILDQSFLITFDSKNKFDKYAQKGDKDPKKIVSPKPDVKKAIDSKFADGAKKNEEPKKS